MMTKSITLTIQRWGVLWKCGKKKGYPLTSTMLAQMPYVFKTREDARRFARMDSRLKVVKFKCTFEVIE